MINLALRNLSSNTADGCVRVTELESSNLLGYELCAKWLLSSELSVPIFQGLKVIIKDTAGLAFILAILSGAPLVIATGSLRVLKRQIDCLYTSGHCLL